MNELTPKQRTAISALMRESSIEAAAKVSGVHRATLFRWMSNASFCDALRKASDDAIGASVRRLTQLSGSAVDVLRDAMDGTRLISARQLRAADLVLTHAMRLRDAHELAERISALEARQT